MRRAMKRMLPFVAAFGLLVSLIVGSTGATAARAPKKTTTTTAPPTTTTTLPPTTTTTTEPPTTTTTEPPTTTTEPPTTTTTTTPPPPPVPTGADYGFPSCVGEGRNVVTPYPPGTNLTTRYRVTAPPDDTTYDLTGVTSTAQPSSSYPFSFGTGNDNLDAALRTCMLGGELLDQFGDPPSVNGVPINWRTWHDTYNAACVKIAAVDWMQVQGHTCRGIQDGFRMQENLPNANNARFLIEDTYAANMGDDCLENDYTTEGVILDSLFDGCLNAFSERPSGDRCWDTPLDEQLVIDHSLFRLRPVQDPGDEPGFGYGRLFKWPTQCGTQNVANQPVIKCSTFLVPDFRLNEGIDGMEFPANTLVDDSACPDNPTTIVWLGGGSVYPAPHPAGIRTVTDISYWNEQVAAWHNRHEPPPFP
jgi:hypothetical protein